MDINSGTARASKAQAVLSTAWFTRPFGLARIIVAAIVLGVCLVLVAHLCFALPNAWAEETSDADTQSAEAAAQESTIELTDQTIQEQSTPTTDAVPSEIQQRVEQTANAYNEAVAARQELEAQIADNQAQIEDLKAQLPGLQDKAAIAMRTSYKYQQSANTLIDLIFSTDSFSTLISTVEYLNTIQEHDTNQIENLIAAQEQLESLQAQLDSQLAQAQEQEQAAASALEDAKQARAQAIAAAQEAARQQAEAQAAAAAQEAAAQTQATTQQGANSTEVTTTEQALLEQAVDGGTQDTQAIAEQSEQTPIDSEQAQADTTEADVASQADTYEEQSTDLTSDRDAFISEWGARINAYLAGSAMDGQGYTFAAAAWDYGVDPRFSPAIAYVESTLGANCFLPYNAWGWGSSSWSSWEEAIYAQVAGLSRGYGPTLDYSDALSYCPPNADYWYNTVSAQMSQI